MEAEANGKGASESARINEEEGGGACEKKSGRDQKETGCGER